MVGRDNIVRETVLSDCGGKIVLLKIYDWVFSLVKCNIGINVIIFEWEKIW